MERSAWKRPFMPPISFAHHFLVRIPGLAAGRILPGYAKEAFLGLVHDLMEQSFFLRLIGHL
jgi:hypothetical protein